MGAGHVDEGFDDTGRRVALTDPCPAVPVRDFDHDGVNAPVGVPARVTRRKGDGDHLDVVDLGHKPAGPLSCADPWSRPRCWSAAPHWRLTDPSSLSHRTRNRP